MLASVVTASFRSSSKICSRSALTRRPPSPPLRRRCLPARALLACASVSELSDCEDEEVFTPCNNTLSRSPSRSPSGFIRSLASGLPGRAASYKVTPTADDEAAKKKLKHAKSVNPSFSRRACVEDDGVW